MAVVYPTTLDTVVGTGTSGVTLSVGGPGGESHVSCHADMSNVLTTLEYNAQAEDTFLMQDHLDVTTVASTLVTATPYGPHSIIPTFTGTGCAITRAASTSGHPGQWLMATGTVASNKPEISQLPALFDLQTGFFNVLAFRAVVLTGSSLPSGATGATTYAAFKIGLTDTMGSLAPVNEISWNFDVSVSNNWQLYLTKASTTTKTVSTIVVNTSTWYDLQIWVGSTGVQARCGVFSPTALPTLLAGGPFTTNQPLTTTNMAWHVLAMNGTAGVTSFNLTHDLVEVAGLGNATAGVTTNFRGAAMTKGF